MAKNPWYQEYEHMSEECVSCDNAARWTVTPRSGMGHDDDRSPWRYCDVCADEAMNRSMDDGTATFRRDSGK